MKNKPDHGGRVMFGFQHNDLAMSRALVTFALEPFPAGVALISGLDTFAGGHVSVFFNLFDDGVGHLVRGQWHTAGGTFGDLQWLGHWGIPSCYRVIITSLYWTQLYTIFRKMSR